jgi:hypothetical protein
VGDDLLDALQATRTIVPIVTLAYLHSSACARELGVVTVRVERYLQANPAAPTPAVVLPIFWDPPDELPVGRLPALLQSIQNMVANLGPAYARGGLSRMMRLAKPGPDSGD